MSWRRGSTELKRHNAGHPLRSLKEAWNRIPSNAGLATGFRVRLKAGDYSALMPDEHWFEGRHGTWRTPVIIESADGPRAARLESVNLFDCSYLYLQGVYLESGDADVLHLERCDHVLVRDCRIEGVGDMATYAGPQESIKVNQSSYLYVERSEVLHAWNNVIDLVSVQYGHITANKIHECLDWVVVLKGGSTGLRVEGNEIYSGGTGGFTAGQGSGFQWMQPPWLHYETTDVAFVNNVVHDTDGAGMSSNGSYNLLMAYNTLYRVGRTSHAVELLQGVRGCDGNPAACQQRLALGGWGTAQQGSEHEQPIPNRNVFVYDNIVYNPDGFQSAWSHMSVGAPRATSAGSNIPSPALADDNLLVRGNVMWNGPTGLSLTGDYSPAGSTCNAAQLRRENAFNTMRPQLADPAAGNFRPAGGGNLFGVTAFDVPCFGGGDRPSPPLAPAGDLQNLLLRDYAGQARTATSPPGAFARP